MKQLSIPFNAFFQFGVLLSVFLMASQTFGQKKEKIYTGKEIKDAFVSQAVTPEEMTERAIYHPYVQGEIVVAVEFETSKSVAVSQIKNFNWDQVFESYQVEPIAYLMTKEQLVNKSVSLVHLSLPDDIDIFEAMKVLDGKADILWSSPNFYFEGDPREIVPNDPSYGFQYHHPLMQTDLAWDITLGSSDIKVGITDDGVELTHSDLSPNIWTNSGETPGDGIDNDGNGYIDDVNGWDFASDNNDPNPNYTSDDHGTHVAGISAGRTNNAIGIAGVSGHSTIMPLQWYGVGLWTAAVCNAAFTYAADNGAHIVNSSYNINGFVGDPVFTAGMQYMHDAGVLHFNSAGNSSELNPVRQAFHQSLMTVSTDAADAKSSFSNYGTGMDISAPGTSIYSCVTLNGYDYKSGTSMAAPNAAGAAALIWSANPSWNSYQVAAQLLATADDIDALNPTYAGLLGAGRVNTYAALSTTIGAPIVESLTGMPDEGSVVPPDAIYEFTVAFSQIMDPATINDMANFELSAAGPDNVFGNEDDVYYTVSTSATYMLGTNALIFSVSGPAFINGLHRLRIISGGIANPFGTELDGDENGSGGDDFIRNFAIVIPPPVANFVASNTSPIPETDVIFTDVSSGGPSAWTWTITPATFSFVNGTDANSQNPEVQFDELGYYTVTLDVSNVAGSDSETKVNYINVINCAYCDTYYTNTDDEWISNVSFNTIDNNSISTHYTDFTSISTDVTAGSSYAISVEISVNGSYIENCIVFIDWNQDCDFDDANESFDLGEVAGTGVLNSTINVPVDAMPGVTRMRVSMRWNVDPDGCDVVTYGEAEDYTLVVPGVDIRLALNAMLEGPFNGIDMNADLNAFLPLSQPFNMPPWNYPGTESVGAIPNGEIVEWVLVELRDANSPANATGSTSIAQQAAFILNDGSIVGLDGSSDLEFSESVNQDLYVVLLQRNHLGIISNNALTPSGGIYTYDFSSGVNQVYGGISGHKQLITGTWGMTSGDGNNDKIIDLSDKSSFWETEAGTKGYISSDYNLDGESNNIDKDEFWIPNITNESQVPD